MDQPSRATIYDIGMHNGDDTDYYLAKGYRVVAVDANPNLCKQVADRFSGEVADGRLRIVNAAIAERHGEAVFFLKLGDAPQSTMHAKDLPGYSPITVTTVPLASVMDLAAETVFVKIDIERSDIVALDSLIAAGIRPPMISAEAEEYEVLMRLYVMGYKRFRLAPGGAAHRHYGKQSILHRDGRTLEYKFLPGACGPFGKDLRTPWQTHAQVSHLWHGRRTMFGSGAIDLHATL